MEQGYTSWLHSLTATGGEAHKQRDQHEPEQVQACSRSSHIPDTGETSSAADRQLGKESALPPGDPEDSDDCIPSRTSTNEVEPWHVQDALCPAPNPSPGQAHLQIDAAVP